MSRAALKYSCFQACGFMEGTPDHSVANVAMDVALSMAPEPMYHFGYGDDLGELKKRRRRETRSLTERVKTQTWKTVRADPQKYGFAGFIGMVLLAIQIYGICKAVVEWLMHQRYDTVDGDDRIQAAVEG